MGSKIRLKVQLPENKPGQRIIIYSSGYVYLVTEAKWDNTSKNSKDNRKVIGKVVEKDPTKMYPNRYYIENFCPKNPEEHILLHNNIVAGGVFICALRAAQKIGVLTGIQEAFPDHWERILSTCVYWIDSQDSVARLFEYWFFDNFCGIYTAMDSSAFTRLFKDLDKNGYQMDLYRTVFKKEYDKAVPIEECESNVRVPGCDATNSNSADSDNEHTGYGHAKDDDDKTIVGAMSYSDERTGITLFWDCYPGSVPDKSQIEYTLAKSISPGFDNMHLIFDRGFIPRSLSVLFHSLKEEYGIVYSAVVPSAFGFGSEIIKEFGQMLSNNQRFYIPLEHVFGMKIPRNYIQENLQDNLQDFLKDGKPIMDLFLYYDDKRAATERENFNDYVTSVKAALEQRVEYTDKLFKDAGKYLIVLPVPSGKREFTIIRNEDTIQKMQDLKGFFIAASNADETPENEIVFVRKRDKSEKSYRRRKTFFQLSAPGTGTNETYGGKMNIANISQNIEEAIEYYGKPFTSARTSETVSTMIAELHKIKFYIEPDGKIRLAYPLTREQKDILALFDLTEVDVIEYVKTLEWGKPYSRIYNAKEKKEIRKAEIKAQKAQEKAARTASRVTRVRASGKS